MKARKLLINSIDALTSIYFVAIVNMSVRKWFVSWFVCNANEEVDLYCCFCVIEVSLSAQRQRLDANSKNLSLLHRHGLFSLFAIFCNDDLNDANDSKTPHLINRRPPAPPYDCAPQYAVLNTQYAKHFLINTIVIQPQTLLH